MFTRCDLISLDQWLNYLPVKSISMHFHVEPRVRRIIPTPSDPMVKGEKISDVAGHQINQNGFVRIIVCGPSAHKVSFTMHRSNQT